MELPRVRRSCGKCCGVVIITPSAMLRGESEALKHSGKHRRAHKAQEQTARGFQGVENQQFLFIKKKKNNWAEWDLKVGSFPESASGSPIALAKCFRVLQV